MATVLPLDTSTATGSTTSTSSAGGVQSLSGSDFLKVLIAQLQQQDPLNPTSSSDMLTQLSQIQQLQSSTNLNTTLQGLTLQQSMSAGAAMMNKSVQGLDANGSKVAGIVTSVQIQNSQVLLNLDSGQQLPLANVTQIVPNGTPSTQSVVNSVLSGISPTATSAIPNLAGILGSGGSTGISSAAAGLAPLMGLLGK